MFRRVPLHLAVILALAALACAGNPTYDVKTLKGKVASVNGTAGLQIRFSAFLEEESDFDAAAIRANEGNSLVDPADFISGNVTVNQDHFSGTQNETAIAVDPNRPQRIVSGANDYVTGTWACTLSNGTPCSALGDGYSGTYFSNDGGNTWCCNSTGTSDIGTLIPGVEHLVGGQYDAGGDPAVAFDSRGNVYYAGLGFNRDSAPNTVTVNKGTFDSNGKLTWGPPTFINPTTSPATTNDKEWIAVDTNTGSKFRDRVYVTFTRFLFNPVKGSYVQSPIMAAYSSDGGKTFSSPQIIVGNVLYGQGSNVVVGPNGTVYAFWDGSTRLATLDSIWMVKSTDGGVNWSKPTEVSKLVDIIPLANTAFRVNSYPAGAVAPNGDLYVSWTGLVSDSTGGLCPARTNNGCHSAALYSKSTNGGVTWTAAAPAFPGIDSSVQLATGYPSADGTLTAPTSPRRVDTLWPRVAVSPTGRVYVGAYAATKTTPYFRAASNAYVDNALLDYVVTDLNTGTTNTVSAKSLNTRYQFSGQFIGDYTGLTVGPDAIFHALWNSTSVQPTYWWFGTNYNGTVLQNQQDIVTASGSF